MAQPAEKKERLNCKSVLTEKTFNELKAAFADNKYWNEKNLFGVHHGDGNDPLYRTPCIRYVDSNHKNGIPSPKRYGDLRANQGVWLLFNGSFNSDDLTISHICTSEPSTVGPKMNKCLNPLHMRLEPQRINVGERRACQQALRDEAKDRKEKGKFKKIEHATLFLKDTGAAENCTHQLDEDLDQHNPCFKKGDEGTYPCFMNIGKINRGGPVKGQVWPSGMDPQFADLQRKISKIYPSEAKMSQK